MAFSGIHVLCGYAGGKGVNASPQALINDPQWSEAPPANTPTTNRAPGPGEGGQAVFRVWASVDMYIQHAASPSAANSPRHFIQANSIPYDCFVAPGDRLAWVAA